MNQCVFNGLKVRSAAISRTLVFVSLLPIAIGCSQPESEDADSDHHMEHFVPDHKPANFAGAVEELTHRTEHLRLHIGEESDIVTRELNELSDIIGWVPELAADSDLGETDWALADATSQQMLTLFDASGNAGELKTLLDGLKLQVTALEPLVARAGKPEPSIHHNHEHDDHDHDDHEHDDVEKRREED